MNELTINGFSAMTEEEIINVDGGSIAAGFIVAGVVLLGVMIMTKGCSDADHGK